MEEVNPEILEGGDVDTGGAAFLDQVEAIFQSSLEVSKRVVDMLFLASGDVGGPLLRSVAGHAKILSGGRCRRSAGTVIRLLRGLASGHVVLDSRQMVDEGRRLSLAEASEGRSGDRECDLVDLG